MLFITGRGPYLAARVPLPATWAARALDDMRFGAAHPAGAWHVPLGASRLIVTSYAQPICPPGVLAWPVRQLTGVLQTQPLYRLRVEVELVPWSATSCELGIRPLGKWPPRLMPTMRYYELAEAALVEFGGMVLGARARVA